MLTAGAEGDFRDLPLQIERAFVRRGAIVPGKKNQEAVAGGAPMSPSVAHAVLDRFVALAAPSPNTYALSDREREVLELMTQGLIKKEIADRLTLSYHTVNSHLRNIYAKLHVGTRGAAVAKALKERLV